MKYFLFPIFFYFFLGSLQSQSYEDSLLNVIEHDIDKIHTKEATFLLGEHLVQLNPEQAEAYAIQISSMPSTPKDSSEWGRLNFIYAASHRWQGNYATALDYYQQNYDYYKGKKDLDNIAECGYKIGTINMFLGNNILSQKHLIECAEIYGKIGTAQQKALINKSLASFYMNIEQLEKAEERYLESLNQYTEMNDSMGMANVNANLGVVYTRLGIYEKAEKHLMIQKPLNAVFPTLREMGFHYDFLGNLRQKQGRLEEAYHEHMKALQIRGSLSSSYNLCESKLNTAESLIKLNRYKEAINHLNDVLNFEEHQSLNQEEKAHNFLMEAHEKLQNYQLALYHHQSYQSIKDSVLNAKSIAIIAERDAFYQFKSDAKIALLNKENEITNERLRRSRTVTIGTIIGLVLFSLLSFFIFQLYNRLKIKNAIIKKALADKNLLVQEIHHRVKNNLQVISSLLSLQSSFITDKNAMKAINDGRNRVQSMAILHQNLYKEDNITGVHVNTYFGNLVKEIFNSYNLSSNEIQLVLDIDDIILDIDTVIPMGLITNELITNALKYAFNEPINDATIEVQLKQVDRAYQLVVGDNGIGIDDEIIRRTPNKSFGQQMIHAFVDKLNAQMAIDNERGTKVTIRIPQY